eukprot:CAMPEP_0172513822 /NCGR_PEP_ID=MMETSP1066-20121228/255774_1 /TAXON_ID=671091 /ORGANISM="Coscinodiscus wailesii, Strain CCMP2513" /LENGTH=78 /DNA_ID=CAMNT_0013294255 /DNA_START=28 /DNA_END=260 /DNA_ORIENTATION=+
MQPNYDPGGWNVPADDYPSSPQDRYTIHHPASGMMIPPTTFPPGPTTYDDMLYTMEGEYYAPHHHGSAGHHHHMYPSP